MEQINPNIPVYLFKVYGPDWQFAVKIYPEIQIELAGEPHWREVLTTFHSSLETMKMQAIEDLLTEYHIIKPDLNVREH